MVSYEIPWRFASCARHRDRQHELDAIALDKRLELEPVPRSVHVRVVLAVLHVPLPAASGRRSIWPKRKARLVASFHTEYSGFRWLIIFMAEYGSMFAVSGIAILVYWAAGASVAVRVDGFSFASFGGRLVYRQSAQRHRLHRQRAGSSSSS